jgi:ribosome-binding factor A
LSRRTERIGEQIRAELARLLHEEATDPRIGLVTLTQVDVSPDLANARVYWSVVQPKDADQRRSSEAGLESAAGFLRHRLARVLGLKRVPELRFHFDASLAQGEATLSLLREIQDGAQK